MEPPVDLAPDSVRDEKVKVLKSIKPIGADAVAAETVRAQYAAGIAEGAEVPGYRQEKGVAPGSQTETYAALRVQLDSWRWAGVPFLLRTGQAALAARDRDLRPLQEAAAQPLRQAGPLPAQPNVLVLRIQPREGITLGFNSKIPGRASDMRTVAMDFAYGSAFADDLPDAYERLLLDAMVGDSTLFMRTDEVDSAWRFVTGILDGWSASAAPPLAFYRAGQLRARRGLPPPRVAGEAVEKAVSATLDPRAVEREIAMIRERESNPYSSGIKTNLFNLVILAEGEEQATAAGPALGHMLGRRPARIITIVRGAAASPAQGAETGARASVTGRCFPDTHSRGVCFEEIRISAVGSGVDVGAWAPLLIRDIPVYAWVPGLPSLERLAPAVEAAEYIDTLITDSTAARSLQAALGAARCLHAARAAARRAIAVSDLAWRRTLPLRVQAARAFDPPEERARLASIREICARELVPAEALGLSLWLASRLGWTLRPADPGRAGEAPAFVDAAGRPVRLCEAGAGRARTGTQVSVEIRFDAGEPLLLAAAAPTDGEILLAEVDSPRQDPLFEDVLAAAGDGA